MRRYLPFLCATVLCTRSALVAQPASDARAIAVSERPRFAPVSDKTGHAGLFVGVNEFTEDASVAPLQFAVNDAVATAHLFVLQLKVVQPERAVLALSGSASGSAVKQLEELKSAHVTIVPATKPRVLSHLQRLAGFPQETADMLVVQMSSHGFEVKSAAYVLLTDSITGALDDTALRITSIENMMGDSKAGNRILLLDACRNKPLMASKGATPAMSSAFKDALRTAPGQAVLASCDVGQVSWEDPALGNGIFTYFLLRGLGGDAKPDAAGLIRLESIEQYVSQSVEQWAKQHGKSPAQHPWFKGPDAAKQIPLAIDPGQAEITKKRLLTLRQLALDDKLTNEQFQEVKRLLQDGPADDTARKKLTIYTKLADGKMDAEAAQIVLTSFKPTTPKPSQQESARPDDHQSQSQPPSGSNNALALDMGDGVTMDLVRIPAGEFVMGSSESEAGHEKDEGPAHAMRINQSFFLGRSEVTVGQFRRFVDDMHFYTDAERGSTRKRGGETVKEDGSGYNWDPNVTWKGPGFDQTDNHPVVLVSWNDAQAFCTWLSRKTGRPVRLPTEAEWEYACRGGTTTPYWWGEVKDVTGREANVSDRQMKSKGSRKGTMDVDDGFVYTSPVGSFGANAFGLQDMIGNVWEWCSDYYGQDEYARLPEPYVGGPWSGSSRVLRGGAWNSAPEHCRSAVRNFKEPLYRSAVVGFRIAVGPVPFRPQSPEAPVVDNPEPVQPAQPDRSHGQDLLDKAGRAGELIGKFRRFVH